MKKTAAFFFGGILLFLLSACSSNSDQKPQNNNIDQTDQTTSETQLPSSEEIMTATHENLAYDLQMENYSHNEKIFYSPKELDTSGIPLAEGPSGTLAYYAPWGNVVLYYGECGGASGLYALGKAVSGTDQIETLSGEIRIEAVDSI